GPGRTPALEPGLPRHQPPRPPPVSTGAEVGEPATLGAADGRLVLLRAELDLPVWFLKVETDREARPFLVMLGSSAGPPATEPQEKTMFPQHLFHAVDGLHREYRASEPR